jgi:hypothetical protein
VRARKADRPAVPKTPAEAARTRLLVGLGSGAVVLVIVVMAIAGVFSGGGSSTASTTTDTTSTDTTTTGASTTPTTTTPGQTITPIPLKPVGGGPGSGSATFGLATGDQPFLDIRIDSLPAPPSGQVYAAWLVTSTGPRGGYPLAPLVPYPQSGPYHDTFNIPSLAIPLVKQIQSVDITVASATDLRSEIQGVIKSANKNPKQAKLILPVLGKTVLRGVVPRGGGSASGQ